MSSIKQPQKRVPNIYDDGFVVICDSRSNPRTPNPDAHSNKRKFSSVPPVKRTLTGTTLSRLQRHHSAALREGTPSPSPTKFKPQILGKASGSSRVKTNPIPVLKNRASRKGVFKQPASSSSEVWDASSSDQHEKDDDEDDDSSSNSVSRNRSSTKKTNRFSKRKSSAPTPWSATENLVLWRIVMRQIDGKFAWQEVLKELEEVSSTKRTPSSVKQHWPYLKAKLEAIIENMSPKGEFQEQSIQSPRRSSSHTTRSNNNTISPKKRPRKRSFVNDESEDLLDTDSD